MGNPTLRAILDDQDNLVRNRHCHYPTAMEEDAASVRHSRVPCRELENRSRRQSWSRCRLTKTSRGYASHCALEVTSESFGRAGYQQPAVIADMISLRTTFMDLFAQEEPVHNLSATEKGRSCQA